MAHCGLKAALHLSPRVHKAFPFARGIVGHPGEYRFFSSLLSEVDQWYRGYPFGNEGVNLEYETELVRTGGGK